MMHLPLVGVWKMRLGATQRHMSERARAKQQRRNQYVRKTRLAQCRR